MGENVEMKDKIKSLFLSWDWMLALILIVAISYFVPGGISYPMAKEIFGVSITVLAIIFSIFFAALAVLITAGDNEFVRFLDEDGSYRHIVWTFKITLLLLFIALMGSIFLFVTVLPYQQSRGWYPEWIILIFAFVALYSLFAAINACLDAIKYAEYRARFLEFLNEWKDGGEDE